MNSKLTSKQIRQLWLDFFKSKNHLEVESKSLVPENDPSLLWINSGVATLKDYFSGKKVPPSKRLTNSQKSLRTNDIENVGITSRHHTMFEMLGNFSIGDYFKKEAIEYAFEFLTTVLKFDVNKLYFTYFFEDLDTKEYWLKLGIKEEHLIAGTRKTNFWDMGIGPCGPCTEIFYDRGSKYDSRGVELLKEDIENDRFIEIWNIVFSQFNNDGENNYTPLISKNIDTGAGLERIVSIIQDGPTNFDTDLFLPIIKEIETMTSFKYDVENYFKKEEKQAKINSNFKIIADHIRAVVNAINDGVEPSNTFRGYIIRRLIRRAYRIGKKLGIKEAFLYKLVNIVKETLIYEIEVDRVSEVIKKEELLFEKTIENGGLLLQKEIENNNQQIDFAVAFKLFETFGFPIELTQEILAEKNIELDMNEFKIYQEKHAQLSMGSKKLGMKKTLNSLALVEGKISEFIGYSELTSKAKIVFLANEEEQINKSLANQDSYVIFDKTPFYATAGGQKHDQGVIIQNNNKIKVKQVFKDKFLNHVHVIEGELDKNQEVLLEVDATNRTNLERNHSSTHLLFKSLREQYGPQIKQLGSDNNEDRLTFDFPLDKKPTPKELKEIQDRVNSYIDKNVERHYLETSIKEAEKLNAIMTLEEAEYMDPKHVRLVQFEGITTDLCGGTHIAKTGLIQRFKIVSCQNKGSGIFRIRAITTFDKIQNYCFETFKENNEALMKILEKNHQLDPTYRGIPSVHFSSDWEASVEEIEKYLEIAKNDNKLLQKKASLIKENQELEIDPSKILEINNQKIYLDLDIDSGQNLKLLAVNLREKFVDIDFVLGQKQNQHLLLVIASKNKQARAIFAQLQSLNSLKGGGSDILVQANLVWYSNVETTIKNILKNPS
ncbi:alanine--tRNA ligase [Mycoplasma sp. 1654_15]|uniref:alanine--tRNA ligase n=1 Tax=Mycoplasma sp. 1654_15 TaxID=2725994 RepID=UPI001448D867|nr:alanine--tRNA ligase [Mycoplasma sp. 1654_15]QJB71073.1 alanine--tRNA ligase [Mycoplasma sp. 1654_15]